MKQWTKPTYEIAFLRQLGDVLFWFEPHSIDTVSVGHSLIPLYDSNYNLFILIVTTP
jgi:hypothetical protein